MTSTLRFLTSGALGTSSFLLLAIAAAVSICPPALAQVTPRLVKDLNAEPSYYSGDFRAIGDTIYLAGYTHASGYELWKSDGTRAGTKLFKELNPGPQGSNPTGFTPVGKTIYFAAHRQDPWTGMELWKTDGTSDGTVLVKDINPETSSNPGNFLSWKNQLLFTANDGTHGTELWKSDGTASGTTMLKNIAPGSGHTEFSEFTPMGGELFFLADAENDAYGTRLWKTDGTPGNTRLVASKKFRSPAGLTTCGDFLYFTARENSTGEWKLWESDGTSAGTVKVTNISLGDLETPQVLRLGSRIIFTVTSGWSNVQLWSTTGTAGKTVQISDAGFLMYFGVFTAAGESRPSLYFSGHDPDHGVELWKTDGTAAGTRLFKDLSPGRGNSYPSRFTVTGGRMYFSAGDNGDGANVLWVTKGTPASTKPLKKFASPISLRNGIGDSLLLEADDGGSLGNEIWKSNGTTSGTVPLTDFMGTADSTYISPSRVDGDKLRFWATPEDSYEEILYETDGTGAGTKELSFLKGDCLAGDMLYFQGINKVSEFYWDFELFTSDGTEAGTKQLKNINTRARGSSSPSDFNALGNLVCFTADDGIHGRELWRSDGTAQGTFMLKDIEPGSRGLTPENFIKAGNILYFTLSSSYRVWRTDGTPGGTFMLVEAGGLKDFEAFGETLVFTQQDSSSSKPLLWRSDGSPQGTFHTDLAPADTNSFTGGVHYFRGRSISYPSEVELWRSDGTAAGTYRVATPGGSLPYYDPGFVAAGDRVVFWIQNSSLYEMWGSDGTEAGTRKLGTFDGIGEQVVGGDDLFFIVADRPDHFQLWKTDGTPDGTGEVPLVLSQGSGLTSVLMQAGKNLYFPVTTDAYGVELHTMAIADLRIPGKGFRAWQEAHHLSGSQVSALAQPFNDGVANLVKYAFFMNGSGPDCHVMPPGSGTNGLPFISTSASPASGNIIRVEFIRRKNSGLVYRPLFSHSLAPGSFQLMNGTPVVTDVDPGRERVIVEHAVDPANDTIGFAVVEVSTE
ncbi:MAG: ELWxxDGT repeat protein [Verrucomicrobiota bacterium]